MWMWIGIGIGTVAVIILAAIALCYNSLAKKRLRIENAFSQIKIQCKRKIELVPFLADVVKGYAKHDGELNKVTDADYGSITGITGAEMQASCELTDLYALAGKNPKLKSNANFLQLQEELTNLEKAISVSRGFYNDSVMMYNRSVRTFPSNIVAKIFKFLPFEFIDQSALVSPSAVQGARCPGCGAVSSSSICPHCGTRIPLI